MMAFAVLFFLPGTIHPEQSFLGPAFLISLYDGLSQGVEAMWRSGQAVAITASIAALTGVLLPVARVKTEAPDQKPKPDTGKSSHARRERKEPL
ncbi:hypothetical protein [Endozoicomonas sp. SCSIO W0465]|uniref:hypothetical protein n=1 Tax=Endozoicomonas sp. SCSIO W0465 TaxID=2918516 RepID=UPI002075E381|nr:hypothetical protein [Endozoicomonas sp. SCSIO W0465]USE39281.1 hypothetical protein MJO57_14610 [Endozoicomonas sp. SCSIO W0465]